MHFLDLKRAIHSAADVLHPDLNVFLSRLQERLFYIHLTGTANEGQFESDRIKQALEALKEGEAVLRCFDAYLPEFGFGRAVHLYRLGALYEFVGDPKRAVARFEKAQWAWNVQCGVEHKCVLELRGEIDRLKRQLVVRRLDFSNI